MLLRLTGHNIPQQIRHASMVAVAGFKLADLMNGLRRLAGTGRQSHGLEHIPVIIIIADGRHMVPVNAQHICQHHNGRTSKFALPKVLKRMSLKEEECIITDEALNTIVDLYSGTSGIRDLEQAAEHIAANALYQIEVDHLKTVTFDAKMVRKLLI